MLTSWRDTVRSAFSAVRVSCLRAWLEKCLPEETKVKFGAFIVALAIAGGCGLLEEDLARKYGPALMPKLDAIAKLADEARSRSFLTFDWPAEAVDGLDFTEKTGNAIMVLHDDLIDIGRKADVELRFATLEADPFRVTQRVLGLIQDGAVNARNTGLYEPLLQHLQRARYALIVVTTRVDLPETTLGNSRRFRPGRVDGVGLLFEIDKRALLGGFTFSATNSEKLLATKGEERSKLRKNLAYHFGEALKIGVEERFRGAKAEFFTGYVSW
jgi:hypothetical protein